MSLALSGSGRSRRAHDALLPRAPDNLGGGALLALAAHGALLMALTVSVDWRTRAPEVVSAELWASVPQTAAPRPAEVEPTPAPAPEPAPKPAPTPAPPPPAPAPAPVARAPEPDIATERIKAEAAKKKAQADLEAEQERKAEKRKKAEAEKSKAEEARREKEARDAKAEDERLARQREENLKRIMGQAGTASGRSGTAAQDAAPSASYAAAVAARIRRELVFPGNVPESAEAEVLVGATGSGTITKNRLTRSSGYKEWDDAVLRAIEKTGTLPRDVDGRVPSELTLVFRRRE